MSNSSQLPDYLITLDDTMYTNYSSDTITITSPTSSTSLNTIDISTIGSSGTYTITSGGTGYTSINSGYENITISGWANEEWVNTFPSWSRIEDMCKQYPGLEIALRNFRTVYTLVKDDYDNPKDKE